MVPGIVRSALECFSLVLLFAAVAAPVLGQDVAPSAEFDYTRLASPEIANRLELSDQQRATISQLVNQLSEELVKANDQEEKKTIGAKINQRLAQTLSVEQRQRLDELPGRQKLRFNFRHQKWPDVLNWFAAQAGLSLVMDQPPPGTFFYSDTRNYSREEAIDLINSVLLTKGFTLVRRERMLHCIALGDTIPSEMIPRIHLEEIDKYGKFEIVNIQLSLGAKPVETVVNEVTPLLGKYGRILPLPQTKQVLITETAGKIRSISELIARIPEPQQEKGAPEKPPLPPPTLEVHQTNSIDLVAARDLLEQLVTDAKYSVDTQNGQISVYARPDQQLAVKAVLQRLMENSAPGRRPTIEVYHVPTGDPKLLIEQLRLAAPKALTNVDEDQERLIVLAHEQEHKLVWDAVKKMTGDSRAEQSTMEIYRLPDVAIDLLTQQLKLAAPAGKFSIDQEHDRVVVVAQRDEHQRIQQAVNKLANDTPRNETRLDIYPLPPGQDATQLQQHLVMVAPDAQIQTDDHEKRMVVVALPADHESIQTALGKLAGVEGNSEFTVRIHALPPGDADVALSVLRAAMPTTKIILAKNSGQLYVTASMSEQQRVAELLRQFSVAQEQLDRPNLHVYDLPRAMSSELLEMLKVVAPNANVVLQNNRRQLRAFATSRDHQAIRETLTKLQDIGDADAELRVYPVDQSDIDTVKAVISRAVPDAEVTLAPDRKRFYVTGTPSGQQRIRDLLSQFQQARSQIDKPTLQIYDLKRPAPTDLLDTLKNLVPDATVSLWEDQKRLTAIASTVDQQVISKTLAKMQKAETEQAELQVYAVEHQNVDTILSAISSAIPSVGITVAPGRNHIYATATPSDHQQIVAVLAQFGRAQAQIEQRELHFYDLVQPVGSDLVDTLKTLAPDAQVVLLDDPPRLQVVAMSKDHQVVRVALLKVHSAMESRPDRRLVLYPVSVRQGKRFRALVPSLDQELLGIRVVDAEDEAEIAVWATDSQHERLDMLIKSLERDVPQGRKRQMRAYALVVGDPNTIQTVLSELFPDLKVVVDESTRRVIVWARSDQHTEIAQLVRQLDVRVDPANVRRLQAYPVGGADPRNIIDVIDKLVPDMSLTSDNQTDSIIANGIEKDHQFLADFLAEYRSNDPDRRFIKSYPVGSRDTNELEELIDLVVPQARVTLDRKLRQVIVLGRKEDHETVGQTMRELAVEPPGTTADVRDPQGGKTLAGRSVAVYSLEHSDVRSSSELLQSIVPDARLIIGTSDNQIIAWASEQDHQQLVAAVDQMSQTGAEKLVFKTHGLSPSVGEQALTIVGDILPKVRVRYNMKSRMFSVWAPEDEQNHVEQVLLELQRQDDVKQRALLVYQLKNSNRTATELVLAAIDENITYLQSSDPQRLLIWSDPRNHNQLIAALDNLEQTLPDTQEQMARIYKLNRVSPAIVRSFLDNDLVAETEITEDDQRFALIIRATAEKHAQLKQAIDEIVTNLPDVEKPRTHVYRFRVGSPSTAATALRTLLPHVTFAVDEQNKSLIATAVEVDHQRIAQTIRQLNIAPDRDLQTRVFQLRNVNPSSAQSALQPIVPTAQFVADASNRTLLVTASGEDMEKIEQTVRQYDSPRAESSEARVYHLQHTNPTNLQAVLVELIPQAQLVADNTNSALLVTATKEEHDTISATIEQYDIEGKRQTVARVYRLKHVEPADIQPAMRQLLPEARIVANTVNHTLLVSASPRDQGTAEAAVEQFDVANDNPVETRVYRFDHADPEDARRALHNTLPNTVLFADSRSKTLLASATLLDHEQIAEAVRQYDIAPTDRSEARVYRLKNVRPMVLQPALQQLLPEVRLAADDNARTLLATATPAEQEKIAAAVQQFDVAGSSLLEARVYHFSNAHPGPAQAALQQLFPNAHLFADGDNRTLIAAASEEEHQAIRKAVQQYDRPGEGAAEFQSYRLQRTDVRSVFQALRGLFTSNPRVSISLDEQGQSILVRAPATQQRKLATLVARLENQFANDADSTLAVYKLAGGDGQNVVTSLLGLFRNQTPKIELSTNEMGTKLMAVATESQHDLIKSAVASLGGVLRSVEVFSLDVVDPFSVGLMVERLFGEESDAPIVDSDLTTRQLMVHGTEEQIEQVRKLLVKMGEAGLGADADRSNTRTIPFRGDINNALRKIDNVWKEIRPNRIQVITPSQLKSNATDPIQVTEPDAEIAKPNERESSALQAPASTELASIEQPMVDWVVRGQDSDTESPPVIVMPGRTSVTIVSDDVEALDQYEKLLRTLSRWDAAGGASADFAVYSLHNAGASQVAKLLNDLSSRLPKESMTSLSRVILASDSRLNALVVHGRPSDRATIGELLRVLDSSNIPESLATSRPRIVPVKNTEASRIVELLEAIYKTQISSGNNRPQFDIPEGISEDIATLLEQINASASSPILTLQVDDVTNSIVMLAPKSLREEVEQLVTDLDVAARDANSRAVNVIQLSNLNADEIQQALDVLLD